MKNEEEKNYQVQLLIVKLWWDRNFPRNSSTHLSLCELFVCSYSKSYIASYSLVKHTYQIDGPASNFLCVFPLFPTCVHALRSALRRALFSHLHRRACSGSWSVSSLSCKFCFSFLSPRTYLVFVTISGLDSLRSYVLSLYLSGNPDRGLPSILA